MRPSSADQGIAGTEVPDRVTREPGYLLGYSGPLQWTCGVRADGGQLGASLAAMVAATVCRLSRSLTSPLW